MKLTAEQVYDRLVNTTKIIGEKGVISFSLKGLNIKIESRDIVGNVIQEWFKAWLTSQSIDFAVAPNTQAFPDFHLDTTNPQLEMLEIKSFNFDGRAGFDVAAFPAYRTSLVDHPCRLDSNYLIFGYSMNGHEIEIKNVWLKKVWEITGKSRNWPLNCNVKRGELFNIRPVKWYDNARTSHKPFGSALEFVNAFDLTQRQWALTARDPLTSIWLTKVKAGYKKATGRDLV